MPARIVMERPLARQSIGDAWPPRSVRLSDLQDLAILLYVAFRGTIDDEAKSFADARAEIQKVFSGAYGRFLPECSFVIEHGEFLASACLITWFEPHAAPLVAFSMTRPDARRQGMARYLLRRSIDALLDRGDGRLTFVRTLGNELAVALYRSLGFRELP